VQVSCDTFPFRQPFVKSSSDSNFNLTDAQAVEPPQDSSHKRDAQDLEVPTLEKGGRQVDRHGDARRIPKPVIVAGDDAEQVVSRRDVCVESLPTATGVLPISIEPSSLYLKRTRSGTEKLRAV